jgi:hypothetical protein
MLKKFMEELHKCNDKIYEFLDSDKGKRIMGALINACIEQISNANKSDRLKDFFNAISEFGKGVVQFIYKEVLRVALEKGRGVVEKTVQAAQEVGVKVGNLGKTFSRDSKVDSSRGQ